LPSKERAYQSLIIPLGEEGLQHLKARLRQVADEIDQQYGGTQISSNKIYLCNLNLIPISQPFIRVSEKDSSQSVESSHSIKEDML
jgi:hypothetical protein